MANANLKYQIGLSGGQSILAYLVGAPVNEKKVLYIYTLTPSRSQSVLPVFLHGVLFESKIRSPIRIWDHEVTTTLGSKD